MTKLILLADDDSDDRLFFGEALSRCAAFPCELVTAMDGEEVFKKLAGMKFEGLPDLIVLDQNMPLLNGRDTMQRLRSLAQFSHIPVVIYSTYNDSTFISTCERLGAQAVLSKPDSFEGYVEMVKEVLSHVPGRRAVEISA